MRYSLRKSSHRSRPPLSARMQRQLRSYRKMEKASQAFQEMMLTNFYGLSLPELITSPERSYRDYMSTLLRKAGESTTPSGPSSPRNSAPSLDGLRIASEWPLKPSRGKKA